MQRPVHAVWLRTLHPTSADDANLLLELPFSATFLCIQPREPGAAAVLRKRGFKHLSAQSSNH